ncbi:helix-turn-helix domain-containing protein [Lactobacillus gasseri]|uniref:helix-turn-helix domain-containing protein n=1 Tax=Lactobacillus gasseri TaxID=1596 RepID=UPI000DE9CA6C|nr:helix-turn-helix transcriptional regulator [Lactobacillus gasseri]MCZ3585987.1 helix-turn-helix domain-containing protein [Lactobacillus gasseri]RBQ01089.1 XRE family transcriptional regulator [Lactobacillus gasseri]
MKNRLKQLRKEKGLTLDDIQSQTGIKRGTYNNYENGTTNPKLETWQALSDFFEVSVPYLQGELAYDDLMPEGKKLCSDLVGRINDVINDELKYSELSSEENKRAIKLALQSALEYYA